jgi:hypothetical protein
MLMVVLAFGSTSLTGCATPIPKDHTIISHEPERFYTLGGFKEDHEIRTNIALTSIQDANYKIQNGYLEEYEFNSILTKVIDSGLYQLSWKYRYMLRGEPYYDQDLCREFALFINKLVLEDKISYKHDLIKALDQEDYDKVDLLLSKWIGWIDSIHHKISSREKHQCIKYNTSLWASLDKKVNQLEASRQNLTDPVLIGLGKSLLEAIDNKKWETAAQIQSLISMRTMKNVVVVKDKKADSEKITINQGDTNVTINNERKKKHSLYGTAKVLESSGKFGRITPSEGAGLKIFDMFLGN